MRIAIPSDNGTNLAAHTGKAQGFIIFDIDDGEAELVEYRTNRFTGHALGLHGQTQAAGQHHSHDSLLGALSDCQIMLAHGMGPRLVNDLASRGIQVVFCRESEAVAAAANYAQGILDTSEGSSCNHKH